MLVFTKCMKNLIANHKICNFSTCILKRLTTAFVASYKYFFRLHIPSHWVAKMYKLRRNVYCILQHKGTKHIKIILYTIVLFETKLNSVIETAFKITKTITNLFLCFYFHILCEKIKLSHLKLVQATQDWKEGLSEESTFFVQLCIFHKLVLQFFHKLPSSKAFPEIV